MKQRKLIPLLVAFLGLALVLILSVSIDRPSAKPSFKDEPVPVQRDNQAGNTTSPNTQNQNKQNKQNDQNH